MIDSAEHASRTVAATRFPPMGTRGVASATSRASGFGRHSGYLGSQIERTAVIAQIETVAGLESIEEIAAVNGVDALFIGPADLSAALGHLGDPRHRDVQQAIDRAFQAVCSAGKPAGIFALDTLDAKARLQQGFKFVSIGTDIGILASGARKLREACGSG